MTWSIGYLETLTWAVCCAQRNEDMHMMILLLDQALLAHLPVLRSS